MKAGLKKILRRILRTIGITILSLFLLLWLLPYILPGTIGTEVKKLVNKSIDGEVNFSGARLSFFKHFPALTLSLHDFKLQAPDPFEKDTLLVAKEVAFGIDLLALIRGDIHVDQFFISDGDINVLVNENGDANYNVYRSPSSTTTDTGNSAPDTSTALKLERIVIENSNLIFDDRSSDVLIRASGLNYKGQGDLSKAIFDLSSHLEMDTFDFYYDKEPYVLRKRINADLLTSINTNSLALKFQKNKLKINRLPVEFTGRFDFLPRGYEMDFRLNSVDARLRSVFTVIPSQYQAWLKQMKIKGDAAINASLSGRYIAGTDTMPALLFDMKVRNGSIVHEDAPVKMTNLHLDLRSRMPRLSMDSLQLDIDSINFNLGKDHLNGSLHTRGFDQPYVKGRIVSAIDLASLHKTLGVEGYDFRGQLDLDLRIDGRYTTGQDPRSLRKHIVITSIPVFSLRTAVQNGYFHDKSLPQPIDKLNFTINAGCPDGDYHHTSFSIDNIDVHAMNNYVKGFMRVKNLDDLPVEADLDALLRLSDIKQFYPLDSLDMEGNLSIRLKSNGNYQPDQKKFPRTTAQLKVENARVKTKYYPSPIEKIVIDASIENKEGTLFDLAVNIKPIAFEFEGQPFLVRADLNNFENLHYDIISKGTIDLGRVYRVFSTDGVEVKGTIETDLVLKGSQADAAAGRYGRLHNSGTMKVNDIVLTSTLFPLPLEVNRGQFKFYQDEMQFREFNARYGRSEIKLNGALNNIIGYMTGAGPLKGKFQLESDHIYADELAVYYEDTTSPKPDSLAATSSGVVVLPADVDMQFTAVVKSIDYNNLPIKDVKGDVTLKNGELKFSRTGFTLADAVTVMDASYRSLSPSRAYFTYHVTMNDFDVKKMYEQVELFRELAPAAGKAEGVISLDYNLEGKLDGDMYPIMPSIKGGGVLSVKQVKMKGFRLFSAMGKQTGKDGLKDPDLSKVDFKTSIKNNVVTLEKTKIKVAGFRLRMQGQTSLDGQLKLKARLGLPPFGIIGIPMNITGTGDNPRIKLGKGDELPLEEQQEEMEDN